MTTDSVQRAFPAAAPVLRVTTDGDNLIIHNVETTNGRLFNLKVQRRNAKGDVISVKEEDQFPVALVHEIMQLAQKLLEPDVFDPSGGQRLCFKTDGDQLECFQEEVSDDEKIAPKRTEIVKLSKDKIAELGEKGGKGAVLIALMHQIFFNKQYVVDATQGVIRPTYEPATSKPIKPKYIEKVVSKDSPASDKAASGKAKKAKKPAPKEKEVPVEIVQHMPGAIRDKELNHSPKSNATTAPAGATPSAPNVPSARDYLDDLIQAIDNPPPPGLVDGLFKKPESLKDMTYKMLHDYSMKKEQDANDECHLLYENNFKRLLRNPQSEEPGDEEMFQWLLHYYWEAYQYHLNKFADFEEMCFNEKGATDPLTYDLWCREYAASAVVGFIRAESIPVDTLIGVLKQTAENLINIGQ